MKGAEAMHTRMRFGVVLIAIVACVVWALPAGAGGWAVVTVDHLPTAFPVGEEQTIGFMLRQHGQTPLSGSTLRQWQYGPSNAAPATITFWNTANGQKFTTDARDDGPVGHFTAQVTFPEAGTWQWKIDAFGEHPMPPVTAVPLGTPAPSPRALTRPAWLLIAIPALALFTVSGVVCGWRWRRETTPVPTRASTETAREHAMPA